MSATEKARFCEYVSDLSPDTPLMVFDIGCSGGLIPHARLVGPRLHAVGFDPNRQEIERLASIETNPYVKFECGFVGVPDNTSPNSAQSQGVLNRNPWGRLAVCRTLEIRAPQVAELNLHERTEQNLWHLTNLAETSATIFLPNYALANQIESVDLIKIDVDGNDFVILKSIEPLLTTWGVLALQLEVNFFGAGTPEENSLHNIDRLLKTTGFELVDLSVRHYAGRALPSTYVSPFPGPSKVGRILQGDARYIRDICSPDPRDPLLSSRKIRNAATILALWDLTDMAAEVIDAWP